MQCLACAYPASPLMVRSIVGRYRVVIGFKFQRIRLDFEDTWDEEDDPSGCNNSYVLLSRDQVRFVWRCHHFVPQLTTFHLPETDVALFVQVTATRFFFHRKRGCSSTGRNQRHSPQAIRAAKCQSQNVRADTACGAPCRMGTGVDRSVRLVHAPPTSV